MFSRLCDLFHLKDGAKVNDAEYVSVLFPPIYPLPHPHKSYESIHTFDPFAHAKIALFDGVTLPRIGGGSIFRNSSSFLSLVAIFSELASWQKSPFLYYLFPQLFSGCAKRTPKRTSGPFKLATPLSEIRKSSSPAETANFRASRAAAEQRRRRGAPPWNHRLRKGGRW